MNNNGMIEYKESFISKIKNFFKRIFGKQEKQYNYIEERPINKIEKEKQDAFFNDIRVDTKVLVNTEFEKKKFLEEIKGDELKLNMLSIERLKILEQYYDSIIRQNNEKIKKLKSV